ncbi:hypothetical protein [Brevibacillus centrosporus]|uniref:hypothetical protein n=1 Tax=Brevibacillus centrosporus TaxID=54910 RepID=UPI002E1DE5E0|nr:hypothetical protein [Brevibacillus centrosporus]
MKWAPDFINQLAVIVGCRLENHYDNNWENHCEDHDGALVVDLNEEDVFYNVMAEIAADHEIEDFEGLAEVVWPALDQSVFEAAKEHIMDAVNDRIEYHKGPMTYYGLSQRDFI